MSDPICRVQNPYPNNVVKLVHNLPHSEMSNDDFKEYMKDCEYGYDRFFKTYYQLACQLGLYYIDAENNYHPRFLNDINEEQAKIYLINWFSKYYVPNPYTRGFEQLKNPILVEETLYEYIKNYGNSKQILEICKEVFREDIGNPDIFINAINSYSRKIKISNNKFEIKDFKEGSMEIGNKRDDKKAFFDTFSKDNGTDKLPFPRNRIIFGAPGTGKSHKLKEDSEQFENQEPIESDEKDIIKQEIIEANELNDKLNRYIAIGFSHSEFLKDYTTKQIRETFEIENCEDNIYVGAKAKFYYDKYIEDNDDDETITKRINEAKAIKGDGMLQVLAGIGFRFSETLMDYTKEELKKEYPLDSRPQIYWVYRAVHGAKYIKTKKQEKIKYLERVTFHPNYSYAQFVGTYKPVQDTADETQIKYEYVPGPFMRIYIAAKKNTSQNFLLLIEEINRANVAAVFGDVFQLLDRDENDNSEYPVAVSEDIKKYLAKNGIHEDELKIPSNMYIWATMNSADQGVFPMDTAFKRRWEFEYIGIDENEDKVKGYEIPISATKKVNWNDLRKAINNKLITLGINEDKLLGPFFLSKTVLDSAFDKGMDFVKLFESKVLMYLFEDAAKMKAKQLFNVDERKFIYSEVCKKFELEGLKVFKFNEGDVVEEHDIAIKKDDAPSDGKLF